MPANRSRAQEAAEDLFFGQIVLIWARWFFIAATAVIALIATDSAGQVTVTILMVVALMAGNFFLHTRYILEQPVNRLLLMGVAFGDSLLITLLVGFWPGHAGLDSEFFSLYYPLLFAFALVFPARSTAAYTLITLASYIAACFGANPFFLASIYTAETFVIRLLTLAAMGGLGTFYWRIQRDQSRSGASDVARQR